MAVIRFLGHKAAVALAISSALAGCSSVEREQTLASNQRTAPGNGQGSGQAQSTSADGLVIQYRSDLPINTQPGVAGQPQAATQVAMAQRPGPQFIGPLAAGAPDAQMNVALSKTTRLPLPLPTGSEAISVQTAAMASPTMAPLVAFAPMPAAPAPAMTAQQALARNTSTSVASAQPIVPAPTRTSTTLMASAQPVSLTSTKVGRIVSAPVAPAVTEGRIQPAAVQAIALDEKELTPDMVALQSVVPMPRPEISTLAYAAQPRAMAALSAMEFPPAPGEPIPSTASGAPSELSKLIKRYAGLYGVPESLVHRVVHRESKYDPKAYNKHGYWGLMQIKYSTAKSMGYEGPPKGLLDAETNLKYAIKYLRGAWLVAENKNDNAIKLYASGYYFDAKRKGMLDIVGEK